MEDGGGRVVLIGLHQVDAGEVLVGGVHAHQGRSGNLHKHGQAGARADEHGLVALLKQLGDGEHLANDHVQLNVYPHLLQVGHLPLDDGLGKTELGNAVAQHAAGGVEGLEDRDGVAHPGQLAGAGQTGGAGADHRHLVAVLGGGGHVGDAVLRSPVGHKALNAADGHRLALDTPDALTLALGLLGADPARDGGQGVGVGQQLIGSGQVALGHLAHKLGDGDAHGTSADTGLVLAVQAPLCLVLGLLQGVAQGHLFKVGVAYVGLLLRHGGLFHLHISHSWHLLPGGRGASLSPWLHAPYRSRCGQSLRQSPPCGRRSRGRPHRRTSPRRPR